MDEFHFSDKKEELNLAWIYRSLSEESYWARGRTLEEVRRSIENSVCFGLFDGDRQVGFARVISDLTTFAYLCDVFLDESFRNQGIGLRFLKSVMDDPRFTTVNWVLRTTLSQTLYARLGFADLEDPQNWMRRSRSF